MRRHVQEHRGGAAAGQLQYVSWSCKTKQLELIYELGNEGWDGGCERGRGGGSGP